MLCHCAHIPFNCGCCMRRRVCWHNSRRRRHYDATKRGKQMLERHFEWNSSAPSNDNGLFFVSAEASFRREIPVRHADRKHDEHDGTQNERKLQYICMGGYASSTDSQSRSLFWKRNQQIHGFPCLVCNRLNGLSIIVWTF